MYCALILARQLGGSTVKIFIFGKKNKYSYFRWTKIMNPRRIPSPTARDLHLPPQPSFKVWARDREGPGTLRCNCLGRIQKKTSRSFAFELAQSHQNLTKSWQVWSKLYFFNEICDSGDNLHDFRSVIWYSFVLNSCTGEYSQGKMSSRSSGKSPPKLLCGKSFVPLNLGAEVR